MWRIFRLSDENRSKKVKPSGQGVVKNRSFPGKAFIGN